MKKTTTTTTTKTSKKTPVKGDAAKVAKTTPETAVVTETTKTVIEAPVVYEATEATPPAELTATTQEASITAKVAKPAPKKPSPKSKTAKNAPAVDPEPITPTAEITLHERVGLTAGSIWHYLAANGATTVATLVDVLPEEEEIIQRSIGWLAQEDKITLSVVDQIESIALKG